MSTQLSSSVGVMELTILVYTIGTPDIDKIKVAKGVDQRFGRLDIVARIIDVLLDSWFRDLNKHLIIYIESVKDAIYMDIDMIGRNFYREVELYNILVQCMNSGHVFCSKIKIEFRSLIDILQSRYEIIVLSEEGDRISSTDLRDNILYIIGAEVDPPKEAIIGYRRISIGPLSYHADQVVSYIAWAMKRRLSGPIPA